MPARRNDKYNICPEMYKIGLSIKEIAEHFSITRQAMYSILKRRGAVFREQKRYEQENHFFRGGKNADRRTHRIVEQAIKNGILIPGSCEICGIKGTMSDGRNKIQAHHDDYSKPLEVRWLCQTHHYEHHKAAAKSYP